MAPDPDAMTGKAQGDFPLNPPAQPFPLPAAPARPGAAAGDDAQPVAAVPPQVREFVNRQWPHAVEASRETGIPAHFILGQAALESGWGRAEIRNADGTPSHNLFGIKAGRGWNGPVANAATTEYVNGNAVKASEAFRSYKSYGEAFLDYARLLRSDGRYAQVLERGQDAAGFARGLQQAGYASDPMYADKLYRIITGSALRAGLMA
jgi:flagellar protein FlgJ